VTRFIPAASAALLVAGTPVASSAQASSAIPAEPVIVVTGERTVKAPPDRAWVTVGAESRSRNPKEAQAQNATAMSAVQQKLAAAGVAKEAIRTIAYDLQLEFDWVDGKQVARGYVARNTIEVRVDDISKVGEVLDVAVGTGATSVHHLRFDVKERAKLEREALRLAVADAKGRAEAAASGAGGTVGRVLKIEEPGTQVVPAPPVPVMTRMAADEARPPTPVAAGEIEVRARVTLTASLK
jgi:uncharacterized protein YggE